MSGRHVAHDAPASGGLGLVALVRRGLHVAWGPGVVLAVLAALTTGYLVATPRVESLARDRAVGDTVRAAAAPERELRFRAAPAVVGGRPYASGDPRQGPQPPFQAVDTVVRQVVGPDVGALLGDPTVAAQSDLLDVTRDGRPVVPDGAQAVARVQSGLDARVRWVEGAAPGVATEERTLRTAGGDPHRVALVPVALSEVTARTWSVDVGEVLVVQGPADVTPAAVVVSGIYVPTDGTDGFWQAEPRMTGLAAIPTGQGGVITAGALVADPASYGALSDAMWRTPVGEAEPRESPVLESSWRYPLDPGALRSGDVGAIRAALVRLDTDPRFDGLTARPLVASAGLGGLLDRYEAAVRGVQVLTSFATAGLTALAVIVLALTAVVAMRRRAAEARLLRARGAGIGQVLAQLGSGTALPTLPVVAVAAAATLLLVPGTSGTGTWVEVVVVALVPLAAAAGTLLAVVRGVESPDHTEEAVRRRRVVRVARRVVAELAVLAVAVLAVTTVRSRGGEIAGGQADWYAALAPVLVAGAGALVVLRVLPWPVRTAARLAARGRGLTVFLGLSRAARTGSAAVLPVVAVVVGAAVLSLLASLTVSAAAEREVSAYRALGAPVRLDALRVDPDDVAALEARPGVRAVAAAYVEEVSLVSGNRAHRVVLVGTDPAAYRAVVAGTPAALPALASTAGDPVPVLVGPVPGVGDDLVLTVRNARVPVRAAASVPGLVRRAGGVELPAVVVPLDRLRETVPAAQPNVALVAADAGAAADLRALDDPGRATPSGRVVGVDTVAAYGDRVAARSLPRLVTLTYAVGALLAAALTLLAVLLLLATTRPERAAIVIRLRTMGLPHGGERALAWTEVLPVVAVAAAAGAAVGTMAPVLVGPAVDLAPLTGGGVAPTLHPDVLAALAAGTLVLVLGALALVLDAAAARRGRLADHLRRGDTA